MSSRDRVRAAAEPHVGDSDVPGGAGGLLPTVDDLLAFARMLLAGGAPVLPAEAVRVMGTAS